MIWIATAALTIAVALTEVALRKSTVAGMAAKTALDTDIAAEDGRLARRVFAKLRAVGSSLAVAALLCAAIGGFVAGRFL